MPKTTRKQRMEWRGYIIEITMRPAPKRKRTQRRIAGKVRR